MKIYGYSDENPVLEHALPAELAEATLVANPDELRRIAQFLCACADEMEAQGRSWEHKHLSDKDHSFENSPHFVVFNPEHEKDL